MTPRHQHPVIEIEDHRRVVLVAALEREIRARLVLGGDGAQAQRADILAAGQFGGGQHLGPGEHRAAGEQRRHVPPAIDRRHVERIAEPVERERARQRDGVAAIDQPVAEAAFALGEVVEMNARGVLIKPRRDHVLGVLDRDAVDVIDLLARLVVAEAVRAAGQHGVVGRRIDRRAGGAELGGLHALRQLGHFFAGRGRRLVALAHHHPARIVEHGVAVLVEAARAHIDDAGLAVGILLQPDHLRHRIERVAGIDGFEEAAIGIAEIGHGIERDVRHGLAEHHVETPADRRAASADSRSWRRRRRTTARQSAARTGRYRAPRRRA